MSKGITRVPTAGMPRSEWLELRQKSIGGSDAAAIIGLNPYASPFSLWADKTGRLQEQPDNEAMRQGRDLERYVAQRWCEATGKRVRRENSIIYNPEYPFAHANIDRRVVGENAGLECKTTSALNLKKYEGGEYPSQYYVQCMHYMAVTGADRWHLAVLVLNKGFFHYSIERDEAEIAALMGRERDFWQLVADDTPPPPDGTEATRKALDAVYEVDEGKPEVYLYGKECEVLELVRLRSERRIIDARIRELRNGIIAMMKESPKAILSGCEVRQAAVQRQGYTVTGIPYKQLRIREVSIDA